LEAKRLARTGCTYEQKGLASEGGEDHLKLRTSQVGNTEQPHRGAERLIDVCKFVSAIQPSSETQSPALNCSTGKCPMQIRMMSGMATIAQSDQVGGVIDPTGGTRNQMMDVRLSLRTRRTATPASVRITRENDVSNRAPLKELRLVRRSRH
jgi:hypothetical protein